MDQHAVDAIHEHAGAFATQRRFNAFLRATNGGRPDAMLNVLAFRDGTACDMARRVFAQTGFSQIMLKRARVVFEETNGAYPSGIETLLADMTAQFNAIQDSELINNVQKSIVKRVDDASVGLSLAKEVRDTVHRIREKDRLAANIALLATLFDGALASEEQVHCATSEISDGETRALMVDIMRMYEAGALGDIARLPDATLVLLRKFLELPTYYPVDDLISLLKEYFRVASDTRSIEELMH